MSVGELVCRICLVSLSLSCKHFNFFVRDAMWIDWIDVAQRLGYEAACAKIPRGGLTRPSSPVNFHANARLLLQDVSTWIFRSFADSF